jgi:hypothetical protein
MKTIGYKDNATGRNGIIHCYFKQGQTRSERISEALKELKHVGNITVYLIKGKKVRPLFRKSW